MPGALPDAAGIVGVAFIISAYLLLQLNKLKSSQLSYSLINALGAALILVSLMFDFNLSAFLIEVFWIIISLIGIGRYLFSKK